MVGIRIEGSSEDIQQAVLRLADVFDINDPKFYPSRFNSNKQLCYFRAYMYTPFNLFDRLQAALRDVQDLSEQLVEANARARALEQQLANLPRPTFYDAVLGGNEQF